MNGNKSYKQVQKPSYVVMEWQLVHYDAVRLTNSTENRLRASGEEN